MTEHGLEENAILDQHEPSWVAQGYQVLRHPRRGSLPSFFQTHVPDAVLIGRSPNVAVEVLRKGQAGVERKIKELRALIAQQTDWRLEVLYAGEASGQLPSAKTEKLKELLTSIRSLASTEPRGALLLLSAALEAAARRLEPEKAKRPQTPGRVVELLAGAGHITPSEAEQLREAVDWQNRLAHGDLTISPPESRILALADTVGGLVTVLDRPARGGSAS